MNFLHLSCLKKFGFLKLFAYLGLIRIKLYFKVQCVVLQRNNLRKKIWGPKFEKEKYVEGTWGLSVPLEEKKS